MKISQIGCGIIGKAWIQHRLADKTSVTLWNRTPQDIPCYQEDLLKAVKESDIIHIIVSDPPTVFEILHKIASSLDKSKLVIQSSTISPEWSSKNLEFVESHGASYVEAPFTGSKLAAEARQVVFFIGGKPDAKEKAISVLTPLSKKIFDLGTCPQASALKLSLNLHIAGIAMALSESLTLARQFGITDDKYFETLSFNVAHSGVSDLKKPKLLTGDFSPHFSVKHMHKDIALAVKSSNVPLPQTQRTIEVYEQGIAQKMGHLDFISLISLLKPHV